MRTPALAISAPVGSRGGRGPRHVFSSFCGLVGFGGGEVTRAPGLTRLAADRSWYLASGPNSCSERVVQSGDAQGLTQRQKKPETHRVTAQTLADALRPAGLLRTRLEQA